MPDPRWESDPTWPSAEGACDNETRGEAMQDLRDAIDSAVFDAYAGGSSGTGWQFLGDSIPAEEMKARILEDPDKLRHINRIAQAVWNVIEEHVGSLHSDRMEIRRLRAEIEWLRELIARASRLAEDERAGLTQQVLREATG